MYFGDACQAPDLTGGPYKSAKRQQTSLKYTPK